MIRETFRFLLHYTTPYKWRYVAGFIVVLATVQVVAFVPKLVQIVLGVLEKFPTAGNAPQILLLGAILIVIVSALGMLGTFAMRRIVIDTSRAVEYDVRRDFFAHLQSLSFLTYSTQRTGDLMSRATSDIEGVRMLLGPAVLHFSRTALLTPTVVIYMWTISPLLTVLSFIPMILVSVLVKLIGGRMYRLTLVTQQRLAEVSNFSQENFSGMRVVKAFAQEDSHAATFSGISRHYLDATLRHAAWRGFMQAAIVTLTNLSILAFVLFSPSEILGNRLSYSDAIAFFAFQEMLIWPMIAIGWTIMLFQRGMASVRRLNDIMHIEPLVADAPLERRVRADTAIRGDIEFRRVSFRYDESAEWVLRDVSFFIPAGQTAAFMGPIGAGKSTLARMLPRLIDPTEGQILLDGRDLREWPLETLRRAMGYAPQDSFLFSETIGYNIGFSLDALGSGAKPPAETVAEAQRRITEVGQVAQLDTDLREFPHGYDQIVGERGVTLSGGQKQRVALARALLTDPRILILDDSFSAVDTVTEEAILAGLRQFLGQRTTILIAHRVSTVRDADKIYVLKNGTITEQGTDAELMQAGGFYAEMAARQRLQAEVEAM